MQEQKHEVMESLNEIDPTGARRAKLYALLMTAGQVGQRSIDLSCVVNADGGISLYTEMHEVTPSLIDIPFLADDKKIEEGYAFIESIKVAIEKERVNKELRKSAASKLTAAEKAVLGLS